ncbi:hypothetical protein [Spartinivicinus ruber]|uniref:hypothetical protein n=1 Tax=Spartinivicinus ruber TaxID=2683272 RepID=UPI0013D12622|nr:hypothetical protein [Spartinivicinus ruber]
MENIEFGLIYAIGGSLILCFVLKILKIEYKIWQPVVACIASGVCAAFIPTAGAGLISLGVMLLVLKLAIGEDWESIWLPVVITRLSLVPVFLMFGSW